MPYKRPLTIDTWNEVSLQPTNVHLLHGAHEIERILCSYLVGLFQNCWQDLKLRSAQTSRQGYLQLQDIASIKEMLRKSSSSNHGQAQRPQDMPTPKFHPEGRTSLDPQIGKNKGDQTQSHTQDIPFTQDQDDCTKERLRILGEMLKKLTQYGNYTKETSVSQMDKTAATSARMGYQKMARIKSAARLNIHTKSMSNQNPSINTAFRKNCFLTRQPSTILLPEEINPAYPSHSNPTFSVRGEYLGLNQPLTDRLRIPSNQTDTKLVAIDETLMGMNFKICQLEEAQKSQGVKLRQIQNIIHQSNVLYQKPQSLVLINKKDSTSIQKVNGHFQQKTTIKAPQIHVLKGGWGLSSFYNLQKLVEKRDRLMKRRESPKIKKGIQVLGRIDSRQRDLQHKELNDRKLINVTSKDYLSLRNSEVINKQQSKNTSLQRCETQHPGRILIKVYMQNRNQQKRD